jgi:nicotinamidase-related amidase
MVVTWDGNHETLLIKMRINKEQSCGLIIDIQERLFPHIYNHDIIAGNTAILIRGLKILEIPLILTQQYTPGLGETISVIGELMPGLAHIEKNSFSCCDEPVFMDSLKRIGKKYVIIAGMEAHICVLQTVIDLLVNKYFPVVVENCISSRKNRDKKMAVERMKQEGAIITTYESILFELTRFAGTPQFKEISRLVK